MDYSNCRRLNISINYVGSTCKNELAIAYPAFERQITLSCSACWDLLREDLIDYKDVSERNSHSELLPACIVQTFVDFYCLFSLVIKQVVLKELRTWYQYIIVFLNYYHKFYKQLLTFFLCLTSFNSLYKSFYIKIMAEIFFSLEMQSRAEPHTHTHTE